MIILMEQMGELQIMFDDFFTRALIAGIGIAIIAGPLGCLVIWRYAVSLGIVGCNFSLFF